jgi:ketosteroid isomerase-like protein
VGWCAGHQHLRPDLLLCVRTQEEEWNTSGDANSNDVSYDGVSLLEIEDGKVSRFRAYFDPRTINEQVVS